MITQRLHSFTWGFICLLAFQSCDQKATVLDEVISQVTIEFEPDSLRKAMLVRFSDSSNSAPCIREFKYLSVLRLYYSASEYTNQLIRKWDSDHWDSLQSFMSLLPSQGLDERMYRFPLLEFLLDSFKSDSGYDYALMAHIELLTSHALIELYHDLYSGRLVPTEIFGRYYHIPHHELNDQEMLDLLNMANPISHLKSFFFTDTDAVRMASLRSELIQLRNSGFKWPLINFADLTRLDPGNTFAGFNLLGRRLLLEGLIDSSEYQLTDSNFYPRSAIPLVKRFQESRNLQNDGVIGTNTMEALNQTLLERIGDIDANFERKRWLRGLETVPMVKVNLPEYRLYMYEQDTIRSMKVCIGKQKVANYEQQLKSYLDGELSSKPKNHETPQVYSSINHMVLNPTWTVPQSIVKNEMLGKMRTDPTYLQRNHYVILRESKVVSYDSVNWSKVNPSAYTIRQTPGPHNALGKIKFMFVNPFNVYLHDTPTQPPFDYPERDVSHGCVRLEQPLELARFLCEQDGRLDIDDLRIMLGYAPLDEERIKSYDASDSTAKVQRTTATRILHMSTGVPVLFDYRTIFGDETGRLFIRFDAYRKQEAIYKNLQTSY